MGYTWDSLKQDMLYNIYIVYYFCCFLGQLNDSRIEKTDPLKGDTNKTDINNDAEGTLFIFFLIFY